MRSASKVLGVALVTRWALTPISATNTVTGILISTVT